jgi:hypothetical protein
MVGTGLDIARNADKRFKHKEGGTLRQRLMVLRNAGNDPEKRFENKRKESLVLVLTLTLTLTPVLKLSALIFIGRLKTHNGNLLDLSE